MPNSFDVSAHSAIFHNMEAITVHRRGWTSGSETDTAYSVANALRRAVDERDVRALELDSTVMATVFHIPVSQISAEPRRDDWIAASDGNWTILQVSKQTFGTRWRCVCSRQIT